MNEVIRQAGSLGQVMSQRPGFSHKSTLQWKPEIGPIVFQVSCKPEMPVDQQTLFETDPLEWCLSQILEIPDTKTNYDHALLF